MRLSRSSILCAFTALVLCAAAIHGCLIGCSAVLSPADTGDNEAGTQTGADYPSFDITRLRELTADETTAAAAEYTGLTLTGMWEYKPFDNLLSALLDDSVNDRASLVEQSASGTNDAMPLVSTSAFYPFTATLAEAYYTQDVYMRADAPLEQVATADAFTALANGQDIVCVSSSPDDGQKAMLEASGLDIRCEPIAREALIFYSRDDSLAAGEQLSLSSDEIRDCFTSDTPQFTPFTLEHGNGSTRCFEDFLSGQSESLDVADAVMMYPDMNSIIAGASLLSRSIGYAFHQFYYRNCCSPALNLVAVDGIYPSWDNIRTGTYPLMYDICVLYNAKGAYADEARAFIDWARSDEGKQLALDTGLCPYE